MGRKHIAHSETSHSHNSWQMQHLNIPSWLELSSRCIFAFFAFMRVRGVRVFAPVPFTGVCGLRFCASFALKEVDAFAFFVFDGVCGSHSFAFFSFMGVNCSSLAFFFALVFCAAWGISPTNSKITSKEKGELNRRRLK